MAVARRKSMPRFVPIVLLLGLPILLPCRAAAGTGPILRISAREVDFGRVEQFQTFDRQILLGNEGDAPLRILKVESSCGCTVAVPSDSIVMPGREVRLDVSFRLQGRQRPPGEADRPADERPRRTECQHHRAGGHPRCGPPERGPGSIRSGEVRDPRQSRRVRVAADKITRLGDRKHRRGRRSS